MIIKKLKNVKTNSVCTICAKKSKTDKNMVDIIVKYNGYYFIKDKETGKNRKVHFRDRVNYETMNMNTFNEIKSDELYSRGLISRFGLRFRFDDVNDFYRK